MSGLSHQTPAGSWTPPSPATASIYVHVSAASAGSMAIAHSVLRKAFTIPQVIDVLAACIVQVVHERPPISLSVIGASYAGHTDMGIRDRKRRRSGQPNAPVQDVPGSDREDRRWSR